MAKRKGLGRGLDALLGASQSMDAAKGDRDGELKMLPIEALHRGKYQPRNDFDAVSLEELTQSIRVQGVMQPIVVRADKDGNGYEIIAGERRWRAAQTAGLGEIPAVVRSVDDEAALAMSLIENIQREDLNPIEEATALRRLIDEFEMTHEMAADAVGRSRVAVSNLLRLLDLRPEVRALVEHGELNMGHARALLGLDPAQQPRAAAEVVRRQLSARDTEALVRRYKTVEAGASAQAAAEKDPDVRRLEDQLSLRISAPVRIQHNVKGAGSVTIRYSSLDELDGILERIH
jgi:ParB family chromosome partitioning protein